MSNENKANNPAKKSDTKFLLLAIGLFVVLGIAYAASLGPVQSPVATENPNQPTADPAAQVQAETAPFDLEAAKKERILGNSSAPIKIAEHASFTCGHCGHFHKDTFEAVRKNYIDTGKAYLVFSDFPLNAPALSASMLARCVPEDRYFDFVGALFKDQEGWAFDTNYQEILKAKAAEYGVDGKTADACLQNEALRNALVERMQAVGKQWEISATPSFVINNQVVISGALPYEEFSKKIDEAVESLKNGAQKDSAAPGAEAGE